MDHEETARRVRVIDEKGENLTDWEVNFIASFIDHPMPTYSEKQTEIINRIYNTKVNDKSSITIRKPKK